MKARRDIVALTLVGALLVVGAGVMLSPTADRPMTVRVSDEYARPGNASVVAYGELPREAQTVVDDARRDGWAFVSMYDLAALEALDGDSYVRTDDTVVHLITTSADADSAIFEGITRDLLLACGGLLVGAAGYRLRDGDRLATAIFPVTAVGAVLGSNAAAAPTLELVRGLGNTAFGIAAGVPVIAGLALRRGDAHVALSAGAVLAAAVAVLLVGNALSALYLLVPLSLLGVPGFLLGWWLGRRATA